MRSMELKHKGVVLYKSTFNESTGAIVRAVLNTESFGSPNRFYADADWKRRYSRRFDPTFSPVPETVDISITDKCDFGCTFCYQDSRPKRPHAPKELVETIIKGFDTPPFQVALGGGEPTMHPDFPYILRKARELGTVPNYTTAGHHMTDEIVEVTNEVCGGVAMTFHGFKGIDWFVEHYKALRSKLKCQVNVHLIADKNVAKNLVALTKAQDTIGKVNLVLLAYYPDVGRASLDLLVTRTVYQKHLPEAISYAKSSSMNIAFSEGLLPYFNSRPELGINTQFALQSEGRFSCYIDPKGGMSESSFKPPWYGKKHKTETVFEHSAQTMWDNLSAWHSSPNGEECYSCEHSNRCATPHKFHYLLCAFASHNKAPLTSTEEFHIGGDDIYTRLLKDD